MSVHDEPTHKSFLDWPAQTGSRVLLRYPEATDRQDFVSLRQESRAYLERWEPVPPEGFDSFGDDGFNRELRLRRTASDERLLICRREDNAIVGKLSIGGITRGPLQSCYFGYWIGEPFAGRGYMSEAIALGLRHAFRALGLHRVEANIQPSNDPSRAVLEKSGFLQEGYSPNFLKIRGKWCDHERWAKYHDVGSSV